MASKSAADTQGPESSQDAPRKAARRGPRGESQEAPCLDEPYEPRERSVIHAELRALAELHLAADLDWWRERYAEVFR